MAADNAFSFAIVTASPKGRMLERMLAKVLNCYKFVWLLSILKIVSGKKREYISFKEMSARMIATAWYPVIYFRLNLGYADSLADAIHDVKAECGLPDGAKYDEIVRAVMAIKNEKLAAQIEELTEYGCPRFIVMSSRNLEKPAGAIVSLMRERTGPLRNSVRKSGTDFGHPT